MERLSRWIQTKVDEGAWRPLIASKGGIRVSHLFFDDDLLLFAEAGDDQVACIKEGLRKFCMALGQKTNFNKFLMFVSLNIFDRKLQC